MHGAAAVELYVAHVSRLTTLDARSGCVFKIHWLSGWLLNG